MRLCGMPLAKLIRTSPMNGFSGFMKVRIMSSKKIWKNSETHLIHLQQTVNQ
jgi:hypothetical protein